MTGRLSEREALATIGFGRFEDATDRDERERIERIARELRNGFRSLADVEPAVAVFGSARLGEATPEYAEAREVARRVAQTGYNVITGGGPGLMEAANRGAQEGGGRSIGVNIQLPREQRPNRYLDRHFECRYFFVRKLLFVRHACAFLIFPGGFGTLDEAFEALTLVQTQTIPDFPVIFFGGDFWRDLDALLDRMEARGILDANDRAMVHRVSSTDEAIEILLSCHQGLCATLGRPALRARE